MAEPRKLEQWSLTADCEDIDAYDFENSADNVNKMSE